MKLLCGRIHDSLNARKASSPRAPVVHPKMTDSSLINFELKEWDARLQEQYVDLEDISIIRSLAISPTHRGDTFCKATPK